MPKGCSVCFNVLETKLVPWLVCTTFGRPNVVKNIINALRKITAPAIARGIASGKRVNTHITVSKYWLPAFVFGKGPTQSTKTCSNGAQSAGIGQRGAGGTTWLVLPTAWQVLRVLQKRTSLFKPGQKKCYSTRSWVLVTPRWPDYECSCANFNTCCRHSTGIWYIVLQSSPVLLADRVCWCAGRLHILICFSPHFGP